MITKYIEFLNETKDYYDYWDDLSESIPKILQEYYDDKEKGITRKKWRVIPKEQYKNALIEFVKNGEFVRFPDKYVFQWGKICRENIISIYAITTLAGHTSSFDYDEFCNFFGYEQDSEEYEYYQDYIHCNEKLEKDGFFDWCTLPDNSDAWSDFGLDPLLELLPELEEAETAETKIVVINKILDVNHQRGDLCSGFIEGGKYTLSEISN